MIDTLAKNYPIFIAFAIATVVCSFILFGATRRYKRRRERLYSILMDMSLRETIVLAASLLNLGLIIYFVVVPDSFNMFGTFLIIVSELFSLVLGFSVRIAVIDILSSIVSVASLWIITLTKSYVNEVYDDKMIIALLILSITALCVFAFLMCTRKVEIILKRNKFVRRNDE